jgi:hypothetical protein
MTGIAVLLRPNVERLCRRHAGKVINSHRLTVFLTSRESA